MRLVSARWVVPVETPPLREGAVALDDEDAVAAVGPRADLRRRFADAPEERAEGALLPGLVNAHTHLELAALAGRVPGGHGLVDWVAAGAQAAAGVGPEDRRRAATAAAADAARLGTAAVGDVGNSLDAVPGIAAARLCGTFFHELLGSREARSGDALADAARERGTFSGRFPGGWPSGLGYVPAPHAPYSVGPELFRRIFAAAARTGLPTSVHVAEDDDEIALLRDGGGRWPAVLEALGQSPATRVPGLGPVAYLRDLGAFDTRAPPLLVHMVHASDEDRRIARENGAAVVLCPRSNLHIGGRLPDVQALRAASIPLALGTDSLASVPDLSLWAEMATLAARFPALPAAFWLDVSTRGGARALRLATCGALAPGRRPGVLDVSIVDASAPIEALVRNPEPQLRWVARA
jgi:cytosine/adenosine deaminase-related metal-dependent hydrolase